MRTLHAQLERELQHVGESVYQAADTGAAAGAGAPGGPGGPGAGFGEYGTPPPPPPDQGDQTIEGEFREV